MKTTWVALILTSLCFAANVERLPSGLEMQLPTGWQLTISGQGGVMVPPGHDAQSELYFAGTADDLKSIDDTSLLTGYVVEFFPKLQPTPSGIPVPFTAAGGRGMIHTFDAVSGGVNVKIKLFLVAVPSGGTSRVTAALAAFGKSDLIASRASALNAIATSFRLAPVPSATTSSVAPTRANNLWTQRLNDKKLVQSSGYTSNGNSGGMNSQKTLYLSADGTYAFRSASSVSIDVPGASAGSNSRQADQGRWRVVEQGTEATLELTSSQNGTEKIKLSSQGTQTFLNGRRWYIVGMNE